MYCSLYMEPRTIGRLTRPRTIISLWSASQPVGMKAHLRRDVRPERWYCDVRGIAGSVMLWQFHWVQSVIFFNVNLPVADWCSFSWSTLLGWYSTVTAVESWVLAAPEFPYDCLHGFFFTDFILKENVQALPNIESTKSMLSTLASWHPLNTHNTIHPIENRWPRW